MNKLGMIEDFFWLHCLTLCHSVVDKFDKAAAERRLAVQSFHKNLQRFFQNEIQFDMVASCDVYDGSFHSQTCRRIVDLTEKIELKLLKFSFTPVNSPNVQ